DQPNFARGTPLGDDLRFVRYQKQGGTLGYEEWHRTWSGAAAGTVRELEVGEAFSLGPKNNLKMVNPNPKEATAPFIPDHIVGNPKTLEWGKPYHFIEIKDWADMSDTGNLSAMLDYIENPKIISGSRLTIYYKSNTYMSGPLRTRIEGLMKQGKVDLIPFV